MTIISDNLETLVPTVGYRQAMAPDPYRVRSVHRDTVDTFTLVLEPEIESILEFEPGQFNMLYVFGVGEVAISISGDPSRPEALVHTVRAVGAVTNVLTNLRPGTSIGVRGPFGTAWPVTEAEGRDVVIVAGGIGLAPLRPAIYHILSHRADYGRVVLLYGARTPSDILYQHELEQWRGRFDIEVEVTVDAAGTEWRGNVGVVTTIFADAKFDPQESISMICGPEIMMRFAALELDKMGVPDANMYISMERNMQCGLGYCGHCQYGPVFICKDGPVFPYPSLADLLRIREV